jgi:CheY-like chemotaxis protein
MSFQVQNTPRQGKSPAALASFGAAGAGEGGRRGMRGYALIIEDDSLMADVLTQHLEALGYGPVSIATTANEALAAVEVSAPALVLADISLAGGESGLEIAQAIHRRRHVPLVFVSARPELASDEPRATVLDKSKLSLTALQAVIERARKVWYLD